VAGSLFKKTMNQSRNIVPRNAVDFYSTSSSDECTFELPAGGPAQVLVPHLDGSDVKLKRLP
jgi:hypothetical protein